MAEEQEISPLEKKVAEQIEYYFGDHNLPRDKFLKEQMQLDDGWITLETMLKFNRLKILTSDASVIVKSLQKSKTGLLEISEDQTKIRRCPSKPLPDHDQEYKDALKHKSVYMKGFPLDTTLDEIKEWLADKGTVENIQMRKGLQKTFKGSIFAVLETEDAAKAFVVRDDVKQFKGNDMIVLIKEDYFAKKAKETKNRADAKAKARSDKEEKQKQAEEEEMKFLDEHKGCLLKFSGDLGQTSREDFHEIFSEHAQIKWIDFTRGAKEGTILFCSNAKEALQKAQEATGGAELKVKDKAVQWEVLEGDLEMEMLKKIIESQQESINKRRGKGGHRGRGRGRGRGGRRDRGGRDQVQFQGKKTKFDSDDETGGGGDGIDAEHNVPKKRALESNGNDAEAPASKQAKEENGS